LLDAYLKRETERQGLPWFEVKAILESRMARPLSHPSSVLIQAPLA